MVVSFDLDDTIFLEREFVFSGYGAICEYFSIADLPVMKQLFEEGSENVFYEIEKRNPKTGLSIDTMLSIYRNHQPKISPRPFVIECLRTLKVGGAQLACITDGRSVTQRNKLRALGVEEYFDSILISEETGFDKKSSSNFINIMTQFQNSRYAYVGDNFEKDFVEPRKLGWLTLALYPNPRAIRVQQIAEFADFALPHAYFDSFSAFIPAFENLIFSKI